MNPPKPWQFKGLVCGLCEKPLPGMTPCPIIDGENCHKECADKFNKKMEKRNAK
jgi:hypothetical protein